MATTTVLSVLRTGFGRSKRATPGVVSGHVHLKALADVSTKQIVGKLGANSRIIDAYVADPVAAGTFQIDLEAVTTPTLALVNVVASVAMTIGPKTVVAASKYLKFAADRDISITCASGTALGVLKVVLVVVADDDGKESP